MKLILDLDTGIDDAMALAYAVGSPDLELIGVTGTYGNVYTEAVSYTHLDVYKRQEKGKLHLFILGIFFM